MKTVDEWIQIYNDLCGICGIDAQEELMLLVLKERVNERDPNVDDADIHTVFDEFYPMLKIVEEILDEREKRRQDSDRA